MPSLPVIAGAQVMVDNPLAVSGTTSVRSGGAVFNGGMLSIDGVAFSTSDLDVNGNGEVNVTNAGATVGALSGDGTIDLKMASPLTVGNSSDITFDGTITGDGPLTKFGSGRLTLNGASDYSGGTAVANGLLQVNNASGSGTGSGAVTVMAGATLAGNGDIAGDVTIEDGGTLASDNSAGGARGGQCHAGPIGHLRGRARRIGQQRSAQSTV